MLRTAGCEVEPVTDGEALMAALSTGAAPDIIVTDLVMPGLSGNALVRTLEAVCPGRPLLLMTGYAGDDVSAALSGRSPHRLLRKPFDQAQLLEAMEQLLSEIRSRSRVAHSGA
jgi:CheY-like chemotaxis protein